MLIIPAGSTETFPLQPSIPGGLGFIILEEERVANVINGIPTREDESPYKADRSTGFPAPDASLILVESSWLYFYMQ